MPIKLPISKSIANRLLILQALSGDRFLRIAACTNLPDDVRLLHAILTDSRNHFPYSKEYNVNNCGTAMRFLTAYFAQLDGAEVVLKGCERMHHRPIRQLVNALRTLGANIEYIGEEGYPPLRIHGTNISRRQIVLNNPDSSQFVSALQLIGVPVKTNSLSWYINLTEKVILDYEKCYRHPPIKVSEIEADWSSAAFWYEFIALHGGGIFLPGLNEDTVQPDRAMESLFSMLGVKTSFYDDGAYIEYCPDMPIAKSITVSFVGIPDSYPAVAITCEQLGVSFYPKNIDSLRLKESDRLQAIREHKTYGDHRIAMALLAADLPCDDIACISKSYPLFYKQLCKLRESFHVGE